MAFNPMENAQYPNLVNWAKGLDPNGNVAAVAEILMKSNPIIEDIPLIEGNLPTGHRSTIRADIPIPTWRKLYKGVKPTKSAKIQVEDTIGNCEDYAAVDKDLADLNGNTAAFRLSEDKAHIEGISQEMATTVFYGDTAVDPTKFHGLSPRYAVLDIAASKPTAVARSGQLKNVISLAGSTNLTSMWLIEWGEDAVHGIYPKGSKVGLQQKDHGEVTLQDESGGFFQGYRSHYKWQMGLVVRDWRRVVRICDIDVTKIGDETTQKALYTAMIKALHTLPNGSTGRKMFYCGGAVSAMLDLAALEKSNAALGRKEVFGEELLSFRGVPIRQCDALVENEVAIS
jgi:hypothetical protein